MSVDAFNHQAELPLKRMSKVNNLNDFVKAVSIVYSRKVDVKEMNVLDFYERQYRSIAFHIQLVQT